MPVTVPDKFMLVLVILSTFSEIKKKTHWSVLILKVIPLLMRHIWNLNPCLLERCYLIAKLMFLKGHNLWWLLLELVDWLCRDINTLTHSSLILQICTTFSNGMTPIVCKTVHSMLMNHESVISLANSLKELRVAALKRSPQSPEGYINLSSNQVEFP